MAEYEVAARSSRAPAVEWRAVSIEYSRSVAHWLKSVDGSQSVLRGYSLMANVAISIFGQLSLSAELNAICYFLYLD